MPIAANIVQKAYVAFFNRPADVMGLDFWTKSSGTLESLLNTFAGSAEYTNQYTGMNSVQIVNQIYQNLFARDAEPAGLLSWAGKLDRKELTLGNIASSIADGAQNTDATSVANKVSAATSYTASLNTTAKILAYASSSTASMAAVKTWMRGVTTDATLTSSITTSALDTLNTATTATAAATGSTFTLTTAGDNFTGTSGNDTFVAISSTTAGTSTFTASDSIAGGSGTDIFNLTTDTAVTPIFSGALFTGFETFNLTAVGFAPTITLTGIAGLTTIASNFSTVATAFTGVANIVTSTITNATGANYSITYADAAVTGAADVQVLNLAGAGVSATPIVVTFTAATPAVNELESLTINSNTAANFITLTTDATQTSLKTITIGGSANLTMGFTANADNITTSATTINASAATGNVVIGGTAQALGAAAHSVTLGAGNDSVFFGANLNGSDTVVGGAGTDIVAVTAALTAAQLANVSGVEKIRFDAAGVTQDVSLMANITATQVIGAGTFAMSNYTSTNSNIEVLGTTTTLTATLKDGSGLSDILNLTMGTSSSASFTLGTLSNVTGVEQLNIVSQGASGAVNTITTDSVTAKHVVTGANGLTATIAAVQFDSTAATGVMTITTSATATNLQLGSGNDVITLGVGADTVSGGAGNDTINIGSTGVITPGADVLAGGLGNDTYNFSATAGATANSTTYAAFTTITDFTVGTSTTATDFIQVSANNANFGSSNATPTASTGLAKGATAAGLIAGDTMVVQTVAQNAAAAALTANVTLIKLTTGVAFTTDIAGTAAAAIGTASVTGLAQDGTYLMSMYDTTNNKMVMFTANTGTSVANNTTMSSTDLVNTVAANIHVVGVVNMTAADYANFGATNLAVASA